MGYRFHKSHRDNSHKPIQDGLAKMGLSVKDVSMVPNFVDLIVSRRLNHLVECKTKKGEGGAVRTGKLRDEQAELCEVWRGGVIVAYTAEEAYAAIVKREREMLG